MFDVDCDTKCCGLCWQRCRFNDESERRMTRLSLVGVSKIFGNSTVVDNVSVTVEPGKVHVLLGENGAGKSTVIKMMSGIYQPDKGHIEVDGQTVRIPNVEAARKLGIAVIHQELNMVPELSIMENLFLGALPTTAGFVNKSAMNGTILAHTDGNVPNIIVNVPKQNEFYLGELFYMFEFACGVSGYILGVNPFNQPGVESYKKNMFALLGKPGFEDLTAQLLKRL